MAERIPPKNVNEVEYYAALDAYTAAVARLRLAKQCAPSLVRAIQTQRQRAAKERAKVAFVPPEPVDWLDLCSTHLSGRVWSHVQREAGYSFRRENLTLPFVSFLGRDYWAAQSGFGPKMMAELDEVTANWTAHIRHDSPATENSPNRSESLQIASNRTDG